MYRNDYCMAAAIIDPNETEAEGNVRETYAAGLCTGNGRPAVSPVTTLRPWNAPACDCIEPASALALAAKVARLHARAMAA